MGWIAGYQFSAFEIKKGPFSRVNFIAKHQINHRLHKEVYPNRLSMGIVASTFLYCSF
jgi:hypothetical protein